MWAPIIQKAIRVNSVSDVMFYKKKYYGDKDGEKNFI